MKLFTALLLTLTVVFVAATPPERSEAISREKVIELLKKELRERGLNVKNVSRCRQKGNRFNCRWWAKGRGPGGVPYDCRGRATYFVRTKKWRISKCASIKEKQIPLTQNPGPHPEFFGYNEDWGSRSTKYFDLLAGSGAGVARQILGWSTVQPNRKTFNWDHYDGIYRKLLDRGMRPLWILFNSPCWAQKDKRACRRGNSKLSPARGHYDDFARFAAAAAERYPMAAGLEVWNEPNYRLFWGGKPSPRAYAALFKKAVAAIRAANAAMPVLTAGLSPHHTDSRKAMGYPKFLTRLYRSGAAKLADMIGIHPYPSIKYNGGYIDRLRVHLARVDKVMRKRKDADRPIAVTEVGVSTSGSDRYKRRQQAKALADIYTTLRRVPPTSSGAPRIPVVVIHRFRDEPNPGHLGPNEPGFGVVDSKGRRKPAYCAVAKAAGSPC